MSWLESIFWEDIWVESPKKVTPSEIEWDKPKKGHTKSNLTGQRPSHNGIIEPWVHSNHYSRILFESQVNMNQNYGKPFESWVDLDDSRGNVLSHESIWIETMESRFSQESIWIKFQETISSRELIWINSWKPLWVMSWVRIKSFWSWVKPNRTNLSRTHTCV